MLDDQTIERLAREYARNLGMTLEEAGDYLMSLITMPPLVDEDEITPPPPFNMTMGRDGVKGDPNPCEERERVVWRFPFLHNRR